MLTARRRLKRKLPVLIFIGILLAGGATTLWLLRHEESLPQKQYATDVVTYSKAEPSEELPKENDQTTAKGDEPAQIHLPSIETIGFIQKIGVDQRGEVAVPDNIHKAGWFVDSSKPGMPGLSVITGHLNGTQSDGVFARLDKLAVGDTFTIDRANGERLSYEVFTTKTVASGDAVNELFSQDPTVSSQLNLITCAGSFNKQDRLYDKRVIVSAKLNL